jgi:hypothetical protein
MWSGDIYKGGFCLSSDALYTRRAVDEPPTMHMSRPTGPSDCTCARHPCPGLSAGFVNPSTTGPSPFIFPQFPTTLHHAFRESNEFHDSRSHHGLTNLQDSSYPRTQYNNTNNMPNPQSRYYQPSQNVTPPATQEVPSPQASNDRKRNNNESGRGGAGRKRQRQPAAASASAICGDGPPIAVPTDSNLPENDPPSSSPQIPTITAQPPVNSLPAPPAPTQLPSALCPSLRANHWQKPRERSATATDVWYFCRSSDSELRPINLPSPDQESTLTKKPRTPFVSCKLCKYVPHSLLLICYDS